MELRHLRYFIAVAEEGHITRAAERLGMQQPPLSQQIKALERELKIQLFRRKPRGVDLTEAGRAFLADARSVLERIRHAVDTAQRADRGEQGRISVGLSAAASFHPFVLPVIRAFRQAFPLVAVSLDERLTINLVDDLNHERLDVAFMRVPNGDTEGIQVRLLMEEEAIVALPSNHALAIRYPSVVPLKALAEEDFILYGHRVGQTFQHDTVAACCAAGFSPRVSQVVPLLGSAINLVAAGFGVSIVQASLERVHLDGIVYRRLRAPVQLRSPLNLASRRGESSSVVRPFLNFVRSAAKNYSAQPGASGSAQGQQRQNSP